MDEPGLQNLIILNPYEQNGKCHSTERTQTNLFCLANLKKRIDTILEKYCNGGWLLKLSLNICHEMDKCLIDMGKR